MKLILRTLEAAKKFIKDSFQNRENPFSVSIHDGQREEHFELYVGTKQFYCLFKRDIFYKFGEIFNQKGAGESINKEVLDYISMWGFDGIIIIYPDTKTYFVDPKEWSNFVKNNNTIRTTKEGEVTTSVPLRLLTRL